MSVVEVTQAQELLPILIRLQILYNRLHHVRQQQGDLPFQIEDLQAKAMALTHESNELAEQVHRIEQEIRSLFTSNESLNDQMQKLQKMLNSIRNEQEYYRIKNDLEETKLTIERNLKTISRLQKEVAERRAELEKKRAALEETQEAIQRKEEQLRRVREETAAQEEKLLNQINSVSEELKAKNPRLYQLFERRRRSMQEGKALVPTVYIDQENYLVACGGCYRLLPRQLHWELTQRDKIFVCESCGRFLVDATFFEEVASTMD